MNATASSSLGWIVRIWPPREFSRASWVDADAAASSITNLFATKYRVIACNADGKASDPSAEH